MYGDVHIMVIGSKRDISDTHNVYDFMHRIFYIVKF